MKTEIKAKFLQHLNQKDRDKGFTLIELLVVIIIIGVLSAIALPSLLNQAYKARAAEAKTNVGSMNRAQQAYYLEHEQFSINVSDLVINLADTTGNFTYSAEPGTSGIASAVTNFGTSRHNEIKSHAGGVFVESIGEKTTVTILCEAKTPGPTPVVAPISYTECGLSSRKIK